MKVVNDIVEREVALMEEYNNLHTTNEEQKQIYCYWLNNKGKYTQILLCLNSFLSDYIL